MSVIHCKLSEIEKSITKVEDNSAIVDRVVNKIIEPYCKDLDNYVKFIRDLLKDGEKMPTDTELDDFVLNLSTFIYFAGGMCEQLGIRDDISRSLYKEMYHSARAAQDVGTVADKDSIAELASQHEQLVSVCYTRAYKMLKSKVENAQELLTSCKKVLTRRMTEMELTRIGGSLNDRPCEERGYNRQVSGK